MSGNLIHIDRKDLQRLDMNMRDFTKELQRVCKDALANLGARIIADAQTTLRRKQIIAYGSLVNSGSVKEGKDNSIMAGFPVKHAGAVEFGRRGKRHDPSLKYPPYNAIYEWIRVKHLTSAPSEVKGLAYLIQRKIGENGTTPQPFLRPAYEKNKPSLVRILKAGAAKVFNKNYDK